MLSDTGTRSADGGTAAGFVSDFTRLPDDGVAIIVCANRYGVSAGEIRDIVADAFVPG